MKRGLGHGLAGRRADPRRSLAPPASRRSVTWTAKLSADQRAGAQVAAVVAELGALDVERAPLAALSALLTACAATETRVAVRVASASAEAPAPAPAGPEVFISVKAAAARLGKSPKWLYRRTRRLPFLRELDAGTWGVSVPALERWMAARGRRGP